METDENPVNAIGGNFLANIVLMIFCTVAEMRAWWLKQPYISHSPICPNFSLHQHTLRSITFCSQIASRSLNLHTLLVFEKLFS